MTNNAPRFAVASFIAATLLAASTAHSPTAMASDTSPDGDGVGMARLSVADPDNRRDLEGWIWYPTDSTAPAQDATGNPVWATVDAIENASVSEGQYPLIVVSHGMYGNIRNQAWLAQALSKRGYLVAAVNHPGSTSRDRRPSESRRLWERPRDLSRLLDALLSDPIWAQIIDSDRIAAAGHSLGGLTVLRLAGATGDNAAHRTSCAESPNAVDCAALAQLNIGHAEDDAALARSNRDPRVSAVVSLDLGGTQTLNTASLAAIDVPVLVVGAPRGKQVDQTRESLALEALLPSERVTSFHLADTGHFDFLGQCTEMGHAILLDEEPEDAMVCEQGTEARATKHRAFTAAINDFLATAWQR